MQNKILMVRTIVLGIGLLGLGMEDLWKKEVHGLAVLLLGIAGAVLSFLGGDWVDWRVIVRFLPGALTLFLACFTGESIGYGDGWVLLCLGCFLPIVEILNLCMAAITVAGLFALFLLTVRKKGRKTPIPFVPFLSAGYVVLLLTGG